MSTRKTGVTRVGVRKRRRWLFPDTGPDTALELLESQVTSGGVIIAVYRPAGQPEYAT